MTKSSYAPFYRSGEMEYIESKILRNRIISVLCFVVGGVVMAVAVWGLMALPHLDQFLKIIFEAVFMTIAGIFAVVGIWVRKDVSHFSLVYAHKLSLSPGGRGLLRDGEALWLRLERIRRLEESEKDLYWIVGDEIAEELKLDSSGLYAANIYHLVTIAKDHHYQKAIELHNKQLTALDVLYGKRWQFNPWRQDDNSPDANLCFDPKVA